MARVPYILANGVGNKPDADQLMSNFDWITNTPASSITIGGSLTISSVGVHTLLGNSTSSPLIVDNSNARGGAISLKSGGSQLGIIGSSGVWLASSASDLAIAAETGKNIHFYYNGGAALGLKIDTNGDVWTVDYADYSASSTLSGWSAFTTKKIYYKKIGKFVFVWFQIDGTSNNSTASFTLPYTSANTGYEIYGSCRGYNNGADQTAPGMLHMDPNSATVNCYKDWTSAGFTASGRKIVIGQFVYQTT
jgi:hypothetical protein